MAKLLLGAIADDFTGATDLANTLVRGGMRCVQTIGVPAGALDAEADAAVVALKSRTIPAADAVAQSLQALRWLQVVAAGRVELPAAARPEGSAVRGGLMESRGGERTFTAEALDGL